MSEKRDPHDQAKRESVPSSFPFPMDLVPVAPLSGIEQYHVAASDDEKAEALQALIIVEEGVATAQAVRDVSALIIKESAQGQFRTDVVMYLPTESLIAVLKGLTQEIQEEDEDAGVGALRRIHESAQKAVGVNPQEDSDFVEAELVAELVDRLDWAKKSGSDEVSRAIDQNITVGWIRTLARSAKEGIPEHQSALDLLITLQGSFSDDEVRAELRDLTREEEDEYSEQSEDDYGDGSQENWEEDEDDEEEDWDSDNY